MKKSLFLLLALAGTLFVACNPDKKFFKEPGNGAVKVSRIDPTNWYIGLSNPSLQLMVYGPDIRETEVHVDGAKIDSIVRLDSPNYLLLYLNIENVKSDSLPIAFCRPRTEDKTIVYYELKQREMKGKDRIGFSNADVLYMLMPDRFAQGEGHPAHIDGLNAYTEDRSQPSLRHGGDLEGIRQHLDYFTDLGVTALWFTPVLENNSPDDNGFSTYHGYATTDYYRVDPRFGTNEQYRQLIDDAHVKGLKVVMDMIFNHCGFEHPWVADMPSKDWFNTPQWLEGNNRRNENGEIHPGESFLQTSYKLTPVMDPYASNIDLRETVDGWFVPTMPDLNHRNPHVMRYLVQNSIWWIETAGIDGIRMDTYPYADAQGMSDWMEQIYKEYPNFNVVGETWVTEPAYTAAWQKDTKLSIMSDESRLNPDKAQTIQDSESNTQNVELKPFNSFLPTVMDFAFFDRLSKAKYEETDGWWDGYNRIYNSLCYDYLYNDPTHVMAFVDNHDTDRFLGNDGDPRVLRQALALLLTLPRIPQLYYGTEILMRGTKEVTDGNVRKDFPGGFPGDPRNAFTKEGRTEEEQAMYQWLSRLLHWRHGSNAVIYGMTTQFCPYNGVYVVARRNADDTVLTVLNGTSHPAQFCTKRYEELLSPDEEGKTSLMATDIPTGRTFDLSKDFELAPREALVLEIK